MKHAGICTVLLAFCIVFPARAQDESSPGQEFYKAIDREDVDAVKELLAAGNSANTPIVNGTTTSTPLVKACWRRNMEIVKLLVEAGADVNGLQKDRMVNDAGEVYWFIKSPLEEVASRDVDIVRYLIGKGAKVDEKLTDGRTVLFLPAGEGNMEMLGVLLSAGANVNAVDDYGYTALKHAVMGRKPEAIRALVAKGANVNQAPTKTNPGETALHIAIDRGFPDIVKAPPRAEGEPEREVEVRRDAPAARSEGGPGRRHRASEGRWGEVKGSAMSPLFSRSRPGRRVSSRSRARKSRFGPEAFRAIAVAACLLLPAVGLAQPARTGGEPTPGDLFYRAISDEDVAAVKQLLEAGHSANTPVERKNYTSTPLILACWRGNLEIARLLVEAGADVNAKEHDKLRDTDKPALQNAIEKDTELVRYLLSKGARVDERLENGRTVLMAAAAQGDVEKIEVLLAAGADLNVVDQSGYTPLMSAVSARSEAAVRLLVAKGAKVNHADEQWKRTALHTAVWSGYADMVKLLLDLKADPNVRQKDGQTPLSMAQKGDQEDVIAILKAAGAK